MLSLPRELIVIIAESPSIAAMLSQTCRDLRAKTAKTYTMTVEEVEITVYINNLTGEHITVSKDGPSCRVYGEVPPLENTHPAGKKIHWGRSGLRVSETTIIIRDADNSYFGDTMDLNHIEKVLFVAAKNIYKVTGVHYNFEPSLIAPGEYVIITEDSAYLHELYNTKNVRGTILPVKRLY